MSSVPRWCGEDDEVDNVGELYIVSNMPEANDGLGLQERNEIALPSAYKNLSVTDLTATNINGNPNFDAIHWSKYPATQTVTATLNDGNRQWDLNGFKRIEASDVHADANVNAGASVTAPFARITEIESVTISNGNNELYNGSLTNRGSTVLDGGTFHGTSIGSLPIQGINTVRLDVLPIGIDMESATYVTVNTLGATSITAGGAVAIAAGSFVEFNTDQVYVKNSSAGNDFTDFYVGNIHAAVDGTDQLRINDPRGVELLDGTTVASNIFRVAQTEIENLWDGSVYYYAGDEVRQGLANYKALRTTINNQPGTPIKFWESNSNYKIAECVRYEDTIYRCIQDINGSTVMPFLDLFHFESQGGLNINNIWGYSSGLVNGAIVFDPILTDTSFMSLAKIESSLNICVIKRNKSTEDIEAVGALYDTVINPPYLNNLPIDGDIDLQGRSISNVETLTANTVDVDILVNSSDNIQVFSNLTLENTTLYTDNISATANNAVTFGTNIDATGYNVAVGRLNDCPAGLYASYYASEDIYATAANTPQILHFTNELDLCEGFTLDDLFIVPSTRGIYNVTLTANVLSPESPSSMSIWMGFKDVLGNLYTVPLSLQMTYQDSYQGVMHYMRQVRTDAEGAAFCFYFMSNNAATILHGIEEDAVNNIPGQPSVVLSISCVN